LKEEDEEFSVIETSGPPLEQDSNEASVSNEVMKAGEK